jgi:hypothetical protein
MGLLPQPHFCGIVGICSEKNKTSQITICSNKRSRTSMKLSAGMLRIVIALIVVVRPRFDFLMCFSRLKLKTAAYSQPAQRLAILSSSYEALQSQLLTVELPHQNLTPGRPHSAVTVVTKEITPYRQSLLTKAQRR